MKKTFLFIASLLSFFFSCHYIPKDIQNILDRSDINSSELKKVIDHYQSSKENKKLEAAYFLIRNMEDKAGFDSTTLRKYNPLFRFFESLRKRNKPVSNNSPFIQAKWDSIISTAGAFKEQKARKDLDLKTITANYLINNIDLAFAIRDSVPWGHQFSFDQFCEYVLAYRFRNEPAENWRLYYHNKYKQMVDSLKADSCFKLASMMHKLVPRVRGLILFYSYPYDFMVDQMEAARFGNCDHVATFTAMNLRAVGIPTAIDFTHVWGNNGGGHTWNTMFMEDGKKFHFDGTTIGFVEDFPYKSAKIYRKTYGRQKTDFKGCEEEIPPTIKNEHTIDVTNEYVKTVKISVPLKYEPFTEKTYAVICSYNNRAWVPQDYGKIKNSKAQFRNMGIGNIYLAMYFDEGRLYAASDPFILTENGELNFLVADDNRKEEMLLLRKYPISKSIQGYHDMMVNNSFQGANKPDFKDSIVLYKITTSPSKIETAIITNPKAFRYVRYIAPVIDKGDVAELEFYGGKTSSDTIKLTGRPIGCPEVQMSFGSPYQNAFDGNIDTFFSAYWSLPRSWAGLDFGSPKVITKVRYCPRSDTNFIVEGDTYELFYWNKDKWISMGKQIAQNPYLRYQNVPSGGLYILRNLSHGKEERFFTYKEGKQVFW